MTYESGEKKFKPQLYFMFCFCYFSSPKQHHVFITFLTPSKIVLLTIKLQSEMAPPTRRQSRPFGKQQHPTILAPLHAPRCLRLENQTIQREEKVSPTHRQRGISFFCIYINCTFSPSEKADYQKAMKNFPLNQLNFSLEVSEQRTLN